MSLNLTTILQPKELDEFVGQSHLLSKDKPLYKLLKKGELFHSIFFGPPGCGKTTLAKICAKLSNSSFYYLDATSLKVEEIRKILQKYKNTLLKPLIFIDEIHRLSKNQQEVLLLPMEKKECIIIGASTENPYYTLTSGIRSRVMLFEFKPLTNKELKSLVELAQKRVNFSISDEAKEFLIYSSSGDARSLLNLLEFALSIEKDISLKTLKLLRNKPVSEGVNSKDTHYDIISAMIKSIRGSDVDAALYYLARAIEAGERADFIARRLVILSSEDIGNANPNALSLATNTLTAVSHIGYPESRIILSQCVIYLASSPKSNSCYKAINEAQKFVKQNPTLEIPSHIKQNCKEYLYPHDFNGYVKQKYMQKSVKFYKSRDIGFEKTLNEWLKKIIG